jgi:hypothetical protein
LINAMAVGRAAKACLFETREVDSVVPYRRWSKMLKAKRLRGIFLGIDHDHSHRDPTRRVSSRLARSHNPVLRRRNIDVIEPPVGR